MCGKPVTKTFLVMAMAEMVLMITVAVMVVAVCTLAVVVVERRSIRKQHC